MGDENGFGSARGGEPGQGTESKECRSVEGAAAAPEQRLGKLSRLCVNQPGFERDGGQGEWHRKGKGRSASSDETPLPISRRGRRGYGRASRGDNAGGDKQALIGVVQELNASIADMSKANIEMGRAAKIRRIDNLRQQCYRVALEKATANSDEEKQVHQVYMDQLLREIETAQEEVDG